MRALFAKFFFFTFVGSINSQCDDIQINPKREYLVPAMYSYFEINHCGSTTVSENDVKAFQYTYSMDSVTNDHVAMPIEVKVKKHKDLYQITAKHPGLIDIIITFEGDECIKTLKVKPLPAQASLSKHTSKAKKKISVGEFKAQPGLFVSIINFDICARCLVKEFELVRIPRGDLPMRHINKEARFDKKSRGIINETKGGDLYLFRNILAKCPGDQGIRELEDMSFEIAESVYQIDTTFYPNGYKIKNTIDVGNGDTITLDYFTGKYAVISKKGIKKGY